ncbi:MAG: RibD family protein [Pseudomonadota bacterium]
MIAQLGQSLDGRIATPNGHSHYVNGHAALEHLHGLRALVDAVVIGASTAVLDNPALTVRHVTGENPARVIIDPNRRAARSGNVFRDDGARVIVFGPARSDDPAHIQTVAVASDTPLTPATIVDTLNEHGLRRLLIEGGATTVSNFLSTGTLHRLHILTGPLIIGSGPTGIHLSAIDHLDHAIRPKVTVIPFESGDVLFDCCLASHNGNGRSAEA